MSLERTKKRKQRINQVKRCNFDLMNLQNFFKRNQERKNLDIVKIIGKYKFYTPKQLIEGSISKRYYKFRQIIDARETMKLDKESRAILYGEMEKAIDLNQIAALAQWIGLMKTLDSLTYWDEELFLVADCFLLVDDEPEHDFSEKHTAIKRKLFDQHEEVRLFFCQFAHEYLRHIADLPTNTNVLDYMEARQQKIVNRMYGRLILSKKDPKYGISSMPK